MHIDSSEMILEPLASKELLSLVAISKSLPCTQTWFTALLVDEFGQQFRQFGIDFGFAQRLIYILVDHDVFV